MDMDSRSIKYPGKRGKVGIAVLEYVKVSIENGSLAKSLKNANDELDVLLDESIGDVFDESNLTSYLPH